MANIKSAKKRAKQSEEHRLSNMQIKSGVKTAMRRVNEAIEKKDHEKANVLLRLFRSQADKAARKNILAPNKVARDTSRLNSRVKKIVSA